MTNESRILTVSYGNFSCTLEGFDDPFNMMKAIAEYFRDLAAEDRCFGAEPLQPDAAMLHRVADREVSRLVGAKAREAGLVIRKSDLESAGEQVADRGPEEVSAAPVPAPVSEPPTVEPALRTVMPAGVAAKLARICQAVSRPLDDTAVAPALPEDVLNAFREEAEAPEDAVAAYTATPWTETEGKPAADAASRIGALIEDPETGAAPNETEGNIFSDLALPEPVAEATPATTWEAEDEVPFIEVEDLELQHPHTAMPKPVLRPADMLAPDASVAEDVSEDLAEDVALMSPFKEMHIEDPGHVTGTGFAAFEEEGGEAVESLAAAAEAEAEAAPTTETDPLAATAIESTSEPEAPQLDRVDADLSDTPVDMLVLDDLMLAEPTIEDHWEEEPTDPAAPATAERTSSRTQRVSSRIVRIHAEDGADTPAQSRAATRMVSPAEAEDLARLLRQADDVMADEEDRRRLDALAHLKAAVAAADADRAAGESVSSAAGHDEDAYREDLSQVVLRDAEMDPSDVKPRRKTVSVRPREPRPGTIRPGLVSPPPLVLVSEQRVDRIMPASEAPPAAAPAARSPAAVPTGPSQPGIEGQPMIAVRTGRLTGAIGVGAMAASPIVQAERLVLNRASPSPSIETDEEDGLDEHLSDSVEAGLASFAERVGVKSLAEMLEAAAAYATCVERRELFTRPQLMRRLMASAGGESISREDGLRSFGTLLRTGRIERVGRGHYVLAEQSPYMAEARRFR